MSFCWTGDQKINWKFVRFALSQSIPPHLALGLGLGLLPEPVLLLVLLLPHGPAGRRGLDLRVPLPRVRAPARELRLGRLPLLVPLVVADLEVLPGGDGHRLAAVASGPGLGRPLDLFSRRLRLNFKSYENKD